jgi:hypothetical protein
MAMVEEVWTQDDIAVMRDPKAEEANVVDTAKRVAEAVVDEVLKLEGKAKSRTRTGEGYQGMGKRIRELVKQRKVELLGFK